MQSQRRHTNAVNRQEREMLRIISFVLVASLASAPLWADTGTATAGTSSTDTAQGLTQSGAPGASTEKQLPADESFEQWRRADAGADTQGDKIDVRKVATKVVKTIKLQNVVPPIPFASGKAEIPEGYTARLRAALDRVKDRANVRLHFVGYTDNVKLFGEARVKYGDNLALSRERAGTTAEYFQNALKLPPESISYEGMGEANPVASNATEAGRAQNRRVEVEVWYDEISEKLVDKEVVVASDIKRVKVCRVETVCKLRYKEGHAKRARIRNLIPPLRFDDETTAVPEDFVGNLRQALANLKDKQNVTVKFIGYTDNVPLTGRTERIYATHVNLSKAQARRVALAVQDALGLSSSAIEVDGRGASMPIASNDTEKGRALNRRIEVEFWYDDALQELPDEPQICPEAAGAETVTRIYEPESGAPAPVLFENGQPVVPDGYAERLRSLMDAVRDKTNVRLRFIGYVKNERLDRRTAMIYGDDIGLSTARAGRVMKIVKKQLGLNDKQVEFEGHGYVQSADVVNTGFVNSDLSRVEVQVVYDDLAVLDDDGLELTRLTREVVPKDPLALNLMRITVDGKPVDDPGKSSSDIQRCTDVALQKARIQFKFDDGELAPRLNVTAWPTTIRYRDDAATEAPENLMRFRMYTNYAGVIDRAEVRIFSKEQSTGDKPIAIIPVGKDGTAEWRAGFDHYEAPGRELRYLLRVYDKDGNFDETKAQPVWVVDRLSESQLSDAGQELMTGYGESRLAVDNIPRKGGTIRVQGSDIPAGHKVWVAGRPVPVDKDGKFVDEEILPPGLHTVEVAVLDDTGSGELYLRDLDIKKNDWFYVGIADFTAARDNTTGPASLVTNDTQHYNNDLSLDGRLAFYTNGKFGDGWQLTASGDTLEGPFGDMFKNFLDKSPEALFRRINPDYYYPTYGDDGTVQEDAPTLGKFYTKLKNGDDYALWGNFRIGYTDTDLAHVDRGLYGANLHYQTQTATDSGQRRFLFDTFAAQPGTVAGRDEFLGTGGSLYFLRHQDISIGSERVRIETRDKDSGMVIAVKNLTPTQDYDVDYLQGRITLTEPLSTTSSDGQMVTGDTGGNPRYLVVRYEYTPGFEDIKTVSVGGRSHVWLNDYVKLGLTASENNDAGASNSLKGADLTVRKSAETWIKVEGAATEGIVSTATGSNDGGYSFQSIDAWGDNSVTASGYRVDTSIGFKDLFDGAGGRMTLYTQSLGAGYSAPGLLTATDTEQYGGTLQAPITDRLSVKAKADQTTRNQGLDTSAGELDLSYRLTDHWALSTGVRHDMREDHSPIVPLTQVEGARTDAAVRATYDAKTNWTTYGFVQDTVAKTGNRDNNGRIGTGGSYRVSDRFKVNGEVSGGDLGTAGRLGTEYLYSDRTTVYMTYALENERTDNGILANKGSMVSGVRTRYSDSASIYAEEKYTYGDVPTGLTHSAGVHLAPFEHWTFGANVDIGSLREPVTGAQMDRKASGFSVGYGADAIKVASAIEYRVDSTQQTDLSMATRDTWLTKNSLKYQINPDWRFISKLNYSVSRSSLGDLYNGTYTEAVAGYGYRPVSNDRLNALFKYTYFVNRPTAGQVSTTNVTADVIQKSNILSLDVLYDLTQRWSIGGKYAYRLGQVSEDLINPVFFDSRAQLYILRADWQFVRKWDVMVEGRVLELPDAHDRRTGALTALYRRVNDHIRVGVGYNFSDFSDDLTDLSYKSQGVFLNVVGTM
jgi:flagellar motor protein MotB